MCRTGRVFRPAVDGEALRFRVVGAIHRNAILEDTSTGSWWYQALGRAVKGPRTGSTMPPVPCEQMTLTEWRELYPSSDVMLPDPETGARYELFGFDQFDQRRANSEDDKHAAQADAEWVVAVETADGVRAYPWFLLEQQRLVQDEIGGVPVAVVLRADLTSFRAFRRDLDGSVLELELEPVSDRLLSGASGTWFGFDGVGRGGALDGCALERLPAAQEQWHAFVQFRPDGDRYQ